MTAVLLVAFGGITDNLIPLYAVGAFLAFTLSQFGMVNHWRKKRGPHWVKSAMVNGLGWVCHRSYRACRAGGEIRKKGAWITLIFIPLLIFFFRRVRRHYHEVLVATTVLSKLLFPPTTDSIPSWSCQSIAGASSASRRWNSLRGSRRKSSLFTLSRESIPRLLHDDWERYVERPFRETGSEPPQFVILPSPYRFIILPLVQYILGFIRKTPGQAYRCRDSRIG